MLQSQEKSPDEPSKGPSYEADMTHYENTINVVESLRNQAEQLESGLPSSENDGSDLELLYYLRLLENINQGVVFIDADFSITCWNRAAEELTGLAESNMLATEFAPSRIGLITVDGKPVADLNCPVARAMESQKQLVQDYAIVGRSGREISVALTVIPIVVRQFSHGAILLIQDLSAKVDMKRQLTELYQACSSDPLTRVANRAEFERTLREYAIAHRANHARCCIIVCDLDFFKMVNDTYGHNVGDQALIAFAQLLSKHTRARDIVARYGGEEFVILCANCDLQTAVERAEQIRKLLNSTPQQMLDGKALSASFGVAELSENEDITDFFVRADKALYAAKQRGRNRVEMALLDQDADAKQDKIIIPEVNCDRSGVSGIEWRKPRGKHVYREEFRTSTPRAILANKIQGYIMEVEGKLHCCEDSFVSFTALQVDPEKTNRKSHFRVDIELVEAARDRQELPANYLRITIYAPRPRMFRRSHDDLHARLAADLRRFLMLSDETACLKLNLAATESGRENS